MVVTLSSENKPFIITPKNAAKAVEIIIKKIDLKLLDGSI